MEKNIESLNDKTAETGLTLKQAVISFILSDEGKGYHLGLIKKIMEHKTADEISAFYEISVTELERVKTLEEQAEIIFNHINAKILDTLNSF